MIQLAQFIRLFHILSAILLLVGVGGRQLTRVQAAKAADIRIFNALNQLSGRFENLLVIPGSLLVFVFGLLIAWLHGWPLFGFLQGASSNWLLVSLLLYLATYVLVIFIFIPRGKVFSKALEKALAQDQITAELSAAFHDQIVRLAHYTEGILTALIIYLMVMKPF
jgi:uncharacterized membrane protein